MNRDGRTRQVLGKEKSGLLVASSFALSSLSRVLVMRLDGAAIAFQLVYTVHSLASCSSRATRNRRQGTTQEPLMSYLGIFGYFTRERNE
jgi:hypothetical protein